MRLDTPGLLCLHTRADRSMHTRERCIVLPAFG